MPPQIMKPIMHESGGSNKKGKLTRNESDMLVDAAYPKGLQFDENESFIKGALQIITNKVVAAGDTKKNLK